MNVYEIVTEKVLESLNKGVIPWRKTWASGSPKNLVSGREYRGINAFLLGVLPYSSPYFATFNQIKAAGGFVRKGEKGSPIVFWKVYDDEEQDERRFVLRYFTVFNVEQCEGIVAPEPARGKAGDPIAACEAILSGYANGPTIQHWEPSAYYAPSSDTINMPRRELFEGPEAYYATMFHEMTHSTGHRSRLARPAVTDPERFGSHAYSKEELCAEMGASFLCAEAGISQATFENSIGYLSHWLRRLRDDKKLVVLAAAEAGKAADRILGRQAGTVEVERQAA